MIKLLTRLVGAIAAILLVPTLALLLLGVRLQHQTRPLEQELQQTLQKAFEP